MNVVMTYDINFYLRALLARNVNVIFNVSFFKNTKEKAQELSIVTIRNLD